MGDDQLAPSDRLIPIADQVEDGKFQTSPAIREQRNKGRDVLEFCVGKWATHSGEAKARAFRHVCADKKTARGEPRRLGGNVEKRRTV